MAYYYLAAQLPYLVYGQNPPMSSASFRELCLSSLSADDAALLDLCTLDPEKGGKVSSAGESLDVSSEVIDAWRVWERALRLNLARYRAQKLKREGGASIDPPEHPASAAAAAKTASAIDSPLEAELFLDKSRWDAIEAFQGIDYFNRNTIYAYLLKLQLMERRALFRVDEGFAEYKGLYTAIMAASENT
ncbi:hypothetical protein FACS1894151_05900 [Spirochaetia bacterium]|nr:hypothetical protein FACS1894151_05900 [Spirochaetia bacterium]